MTEPGSQPHAGPRGTPHGSRIPADWPREAELQAYVCTNCGFWQKRFERPATCPLCEDFRHVLPERGFEFLDAGEAAERSRCSWSEVRPGVWRYSLDTPLGISPSGYVLVRLEGNVAFEASALYDDGALDHIESLGGVAYASASHPHTYGALWRLAERFGCEVAIHREDLGWARAFGVTLPFDAALDLPGGLRLINTGGHFAGHSVLHDPGNRRLYIGDAVKLELAGSDPEGRTADGISTHKAFVRRIPLTPDEAHRYREVFSGLGFDETFTPFEQCTNVGEREVLALLDAQLERRPFVEVLPL
ncbi:MBL fold metallo-hydrolase [Rubrobacter aplysinae]|uniref:hypothetical protein n=1 Tax=Rubrobacter aplysinae TaxID=909625 RepID=UPI001910CC8D|nr:hypothetical protein [Rubrobacter aplysinae]